MSLPPSLPLPALLQLWHWARRPAELMQRAERVCGQTFTLKLPTFKLVLTSEREAIRTIFAAKADEMLAGRFSFIVRSVVGETSILLCDGAEHLQRRKLLLPSFHGDRMRFYGTTIADITRRTVAKWSAGDVFSLRRYTQEIALQVILRSVFGADERADLSELSAHVRHMFKRLEKPLGFLLLLYLAKRPEAETRQPWKWLLRHRERTNRFLYELIAAGRRGQRQETRKDVLATLLAARDEHGAGLSDDNLRDELMTALIAGYETTATTLAWAMERLLATPEVFATLREEIAALGPDPEPERLASLPYLDATIKEVLRLRPVIPIVGRVLAKPYALSGYELPADTHVAANIFMAHRNPNVYPDPEAFKPERFLGVTPDPASWLPFGGGLRRCLGAAFAMYEMKIVLSTLISSCDLELAQPAPVRVVRRAVAFSPAQGTRVRVRRIAGEPGRVRSFGESRARNP
jgi:cytochrome P450